MEETNNQHDETRRIFGSANDDAGALEQGQEDEEDEFRSSNDDDDDDVSSIVTWDEIDGSMEDMKEFLESKIRRATLPWDALDFGTPSRNRKIDPARVHLLEETLKQIPRLRRITVNLRRMDPHAATFAEIALSRGPYIESVDLRNDNLGSCHPEILAPLIRGISQNANKLGKHLKLKNVVLSDADAAQVLKPAGRISNLTEIKCRNCSKGIAKSLLDAAAHQPTVRVAKFGHERDQDTEWESNIAFSFRNLIGSSQSLQKLELGPISPSFLDNVILPLSMNRSLQELVLTGCNCYASNWEQTGKKIAAIIHASQSLKKLILRSFRLDVRAWSEIAFAMRKNASLLTLHLDWETTKDFYYRNITAPDFRNLAHSNGVLKELKIAGEYLSTDRVKDFKWAVGEMRLESLILSRVRTEFACATFAGLAFNKMLRKLDIEIRFLNEPFVTSLREMLQVNRSIKSLIVRCTGTGNYLLSEIAALLENKSCSLEEFGVHGVSIFHTSIPSLLRLLTAVNKTKRFKSLSFQDSILDVESYRILCDTLPHMKFLRHLAFSFPRFLLNREMEKELIPILHEQLLLAMTANQSLTSIRVHPFPWDMTKCALSYCNRNRLRLFQDDKAATPAYLPHVLASLRNYGSDHSAVYLTVKRYLDILPGKVSRKRSRGSSLSALIMSP